MEHDALLAMYPGTRKARTGVSLLCRTVGGMCTSATWQLGGTLLMRAREIRRGLREFKPLVGWTVDKLTTTTMRRQPWRSALVHSLCYGHCARESCSALWQAALHR